MLSRIAALAVFLAVGLPAVVFADPINLFVTTSQSGAQVQMDINHPQHWQITPTVDVSNVVGGRFEMKSGPKTSADVIFNIYEGADSSGPLRLSTTLTSASFTQSFSPILFQAPSGITLQAGQLYTAIMTAQSAPDQQDVAYFIKESISPAFFSDSNGNPVNPTPEPSSLCIFALLGGVGMAWRSYSRTRGKKS